MSSLTIQPTSTLTSAHVWAPGDKSFSHRALIFSALSTGNTTIKNLLLSEDVQCTKKILTQLGVSITEDKDATEDIAEDVVVVSGVGVSGLRQSPENLYCGNSGTAMRLLTGLLSAQQFPSTLTGDDSLSSRPMERIITPLTKMGCSITSHNKHAPLTSNPVATIEPLFYELPMPSAQVKSAILLAGLYAKGITTVLEPIATRTTTETMLATCGVSINRMGNQIHLVGPITSIQTPSVWHVPSDISSAAFFMVAAVLCRHQGITFHNIQHDATRDGILQYFKLANISFTIKDETVYIPSNAAADATKDTIYFGGDLVARAIDEIPIIAVLASCLPGKTVITDASELRVKESDRVTATVATLQKLGVAITELSDGMAIEGNPEPPYPGKLYPGGAVDSFGDHRIAMAAAMMATRSSNPITVQNTDPIATSYPNFVEDARNLGFTILA